MTQRLRPPNKTDCSIVSLLLTHVIIKIIFQNTSNEDSDSSDSTASVDSSDEDHQPKRKKRRVNVVRSLLSSSSSEPEPESDSGSTTTARSGSDCFGIAARAKNQLDFLLTKDAKLRNRAVVVISYMNRRAAELVRGLSNSRP